MTYTVISMPGGFRRHLVGKTLINVFHCESAEIRFVSEIVSYRHFHEPADRMFIFITR